MNLGNQDKALENLLAVQRALDINIIMSVTDRKGIIVSANKKFCEISQFGESELVGRSHNIINSGYHSKAFFTGLWKTILGGSVWHGEIKNRAKDGSFYWVDTVIVPVFDEDKKIQQFLSLRTLITDKKEAELALEEVTFTISHKIRQPLVNMQALIILSSVEGTSNVELKEMAAYMQSELDRMDALTREMALDLDRYKKKLAFKPR